MKRESLVMFGSIGTAPTDKDFIGLDKELNHDFKLTKEEIIYLKDKIKLGLDTFIDMTKEMIERIEEYYKYKEKTDKALEVLNKEFNGKYLKFQISSNLIETKNFIFHHCRYHGYWAVLSIEEPELCDKAYKLMLEFANDKTIYSQIDKDVDFKSFGSEARGGHSIFDRCLYHYNNIFKQEI